MPEPEITLVEGKERRDEFIESIGTEAQTRPRPEHDKALQMINDADYSPALTPEINARVLRKIDLHILPILLGIYFSLSKLKPGCCSLSFPSSFTFYSIGMACLGY